MLNENMIISWSNFKNHCVDCWPPWLNRKQSCFLVKPFRALVNSLWNNFVSRNCKCDLPVSGVLHWYNHPFSDNQTSIQIRCRDAQRRFQQSPRSVGITNINHGYLRVPPTSVAPNMCVCVCVCLIRPKPRVRLWLVTMKVLCILFGSSV